MDPGRTHGTAEDDGQDPLLPVRLSPHRAFATADGQLAPRGPVASRRFPRDVLAGAAGAGLESVTVLLGVE